MFAYKGKPKGRGFGAKEIRYDKYRLQSWGNVYLSSFTILFPYYASKGFHTNSYWREDIFREWGKADRLWYSRRPWNYAGFKNSWGANVQNRVFGAGAGSTPFGYRAQAMWTDQIPADQGNIAGHKATTFSAPVMAGFIGVTNDNPMRHQINLDLQWMYRNGL